MLFPRILKRITLSTLAKGLTPKIAFQRGDPTSPSRTIDRYLRPPSSLDLHWPPKRTGMAHNYHHLPYKRKPDSSLSEAAAAAVAADIEQPSRYRLQRALNAGGMHWMQNAGARVPTPGFSWGLQGWNRHADRSYVTKDPGRDLSPSFVAISSRPTNQSVPSVWKI